MRKISAFVIACLAAAVIVLSIEFVRKGSTPTDDLPEFHTTFQMVLLDTGQVYYGKLSRLGTPYPEMTDVYYIVTTEDPKTKQMRHVLVKRGKELHAPTVTYYNARHIVMIENVGPNSEVARLIAEYQAHPEGALPPEGVPGVSPPSSAMPSTPPPNAPRKKARHK